MYRRPRQPLDWLAVVPPFVSLTPRPQHLSLPWAADSDMRPNIDNQGFTLNLYTHQSW